MKQPNGAIIYRGPSMLDGAPIVVIATGFAKASANTKTGAMLQTWILHDDVSPVEAIHDGADASVCGDCPHRGTIEDGRNRGRTCYVLVHNAPRAVWAAYKRGNYGHMHARAAGADRVVRIGSYGDPAAVPTSVWREFTAEATSWTGYTHQWRTATDLQPYCMASVDNDAESATAQLGGWRTFRVRTADTATMANEVQCPASEESGRKTTCAACNLCQGTTSKSRKSITIVVHGPGRKTFTRAAA